MSMPPANKRYIRIELDYGNCYYEGDSPILSILYYETLEEAKKGYPDRVIDAYTCEEV